MKPTIQQQNTINAPLGNILVSAAAGSGKTSVMTKRIVSRILQRQTDIRKILVMTFTDAAAKSMQEKIQKALREESINCESKNNKMYLKNQVKYIHQSNISTIHSFCLDVIKNFYYELTDENENINIEPGFSVADPKEAEIILKLALDELFKKYYEKCDLSPDDQKNKDFMQFINSYGSFKSDDLAKKAVLSMYYFLVSMPNYKDWLVSQKEEIVKTISDFDNTEWFRLAKEGLNLRMENAEISLETIKEIMKTDPVLYKDHKKNKIEFEDINNFLMFLDETYEFVKDENITWDDIYEKFKQLPPCPKLRVTRNDSSEKEEIMELLKAGVAELIYYTTGLMGTNKYSDYFSFDPIFMFSKDRNALVDDLREMYPAIEILTELLLELDLSYNNEKRQEKIIDFKDFEHLALKILKKESVNQYYKDKFDEIYIDEYQDTSSLQEEILSLISNENIFFVGDVKQSIYKFRHAKPQLFMEKYNKYRPYSGDFEIKGTLFELNKNFRSLDTVLRGVNNVFYQIMSIKAGEIDYNKDHALALHRVNDENSGFNKIKLLLYDVKDLLKDDMEQIEEETENEDEESWNDYGKYEKEAKGVAFEIYKLIHEKNCKPKQIAILARTKDICETFANALDELNIPNESESKNVFLDKYEQKVLESLLYVLDNARQDIPLASVMSSPVFEGGFSEEELFEIRSLHFEKEYFHECVFEYSRNGENKKLKTKIEKFYEYINNLRESLVYKRISLLMQEVVESGPLMVYSAGLKNQFEGIKAMENFIDWVRGLEERRNIDLHKLIGIIKEIKDKSPEDSPFKIEESISDCVKIMTIHKSKGLEFENVFLVGNNRNLASLDLKSKIIHDQDKGITFNYVNYQKQYSYPTIPQVLMREEIKKSQMAEEMRLLYVAMTRAMDRLFISATFDGENLNENKGLLRIIEKARLIPLEEKIPDYLVLSAKNSIEWIVMALARNPFCDFSPIIFENEESLQNVNLNKNYFYDDCWNIQIKDIKEIALDYANLLEEKLEVEKEEEYSIIETVGEEYKSHVNRKYFFEYQHLDSTKIFLKTSVSEIKRKNASRDEDSITAINTSLRDISEISEGINPAQRGNIVHSFFRYHNPEKIMNKREEEAILEHINEMQKIGIFTEQETNLLYKNSDKFLNYFKSDLANEIYKRENLAEIEVYREMPFTLKIDPKEFYKSKTFNKEDYIYVQGIIDLWYKDSSTNMGVVVDFKTDKIFGSKEYIKEALTKKYAMQMQMYARAIEEIEDIKISKCIIWHFESGSSFEIKIALD